MTTLRDLRPPRTAGYADAQTVADILAAAFADDPMWSTWAFPKRLRRRAHRAAVFRMFVDGALRYPWTWIADKDAAVAMWIPPRRSWCDRPAGIGARGSVATSAR
jgi:hypothetical protein